MELRTFIATAKYPSLYNGMDTGYDPAVLPPYYGPRSWNIFDQRADNYFRGDTNWACCGVQGALAPAGYVPDCVDGVGRTVGQRPPTVGFTLSPAAYIDVGLPGGNANYYADGVPGWIDYNVAEDYFKVSYSNGQHWTANCSRLQINTPVIPTQVPFKETFTFCIPEDFPFDHIYYAQHPTYINPGPKQGLFRNRDTLIWQKKHAISNTNGPFMSMYVTVGAATNLPYLSIGIGAPRVEVLGMDLVKGKWYTLEIYYMLGSYKYNRVFGTLDGIPFEHTFTGWAVQGDAADVARLSNGPTGMCGIYSYYNSDTSTYYDVDNELPMNDPLNSPTKSIYVRRWKFEQMSNPSLLKPVLPRNPRV